MIYPEKTMRQRLMERSMRRAKRIKELCYLFFLAVLGCILGGAIYFLDGAANTCDTNTVPVQQGRIQSSNGQDSRLGDRGGRRHGIQIMSVASAAKREIPDEEKPKKQPLEYEMRVQATAYWTHDPIDASGHGIAYDGTPAVAYKTCAVDPKVIPLQSMVYVPTIGWLRANDTGNAIKGEIIDIAMPSRQAAWNWGRRSILIKVRPPQHPKEETK